MDTRKYARRTPLANNGAHCSKRVQRFSRTWLLQAVMREKGPESEGMITVGEREHLVNQEEALSQACQVQNPQKQPRLRAKVAITNVTRVGGYSKISYK